MPVFKVCLKIINKNKGVMSVYIIAFVMVSMIVMKMNQSSETPGNYEDTKVTIAILSEEMTPLTLGLEQVLSKVAEIEVIEDDQETIQDAFYFRALHMIVRIPSGFTQSVLNGEPLPLVTTTIPNSTESMQVTLQIEQFMKLTDLYRAGNPDILEDELIKNILGNMDIQTKVTLIDPNPKAVTGSLMPFFFNYLAYSYMFVMMLCVTSIMLVFNRKEIKWRNACGPLNGYKMSGQILLANGVFAFGVWLLLVVLCLAFDFRNAFKMNTVYFMLNSIVFGLSVLGLSFLLGNLVKSRDASSAIANIITLSSCFISGVFVPQAFLGDSVLRVASFFPTYWYVKANNQIADLTTFNLTSLNEILGLFLIELGFATAFIVVSLAVGKRRANLS